MILIAFDLDGTLEDSRKDMVAAIQRLRQRLHLPHRNHEELVPWVSKGMPTLYRKCFDDLGSHKKLKEAYESEYGAKIAEHTPGTTLTWRTNGGILRGAAPAAAARWLLSVRVVVSSSCMQRA